MIFIHNFHKFPGKRFLFLVLLLTLVLTGCGKDKAVENYRANMTQFFENIQTINDAINQLDPNDENVGDQLLPLLDSLDKSFSQMASLEVPDGFPGVADLAADASKYMTEAVSCYHQAYSGEEYDKTSADIAYQNYQFANKRLQYIVQILHGDIPEEIFTYDEDDSTGSTDSSADDFTEDDTSTDSAEDAYEDSEDSSEEDEFAYGDVPGTSTEDSAEASDEETVE